MSTKPESGGRETPQKRAGRRLDAKTLGAICVGGLLVAFAVANSQKVEVDFLLFTSHTPLVVVIVITLLLGFILGNLTRRRTHPGRSRRR